MGPNVVGSLGYRRAWGKEHANNCVDFEGVSRAAGKSVIRPVEFPELALCKSRDYSSDRPREGGFRGCYLFKVP
jgi:hypothetical protein